MVRRMFTPSVSILLNVPTATVISLFREFAFCSLSSVRDVAYVIIEIDDATMQAARQSAGKIIFFIIDVEFLSSMFIRRRCVPEYYRRQREIYDITPPS